MGNAYSSDFRDRVVAAVEKKGMSRCPRLGQPTFRTTSSTARRHPAASSSVLRKLHSAET